MESHMNNNRVEGAGRKAAGAIKEAAGKITGDKTLEAKGAVQKNLGKAQNAAGKAEDVLKH
jgi:uncharacterized protein YjbJ (UPF0337 family)